MSGRAARRVWERKWALCTGSNSDAMSSSWRSVDKVGLSKCLIRASIWTAGRCSTSLLNTFSKHSFRLAPNSSFNTSTATSNWSITTAYVSKLFRQSMSFLPPKNQNSYINNFILQLTWIDPTNQNTQWENVCSQRDCIAWRRKIFGCQKVQIRLQIER